MMKDNHVDYLTLRLGDELYAIDVASVKEIRSFEPVTKLSGVPEFMLGITNLRGDIVPIADLRIKFGVGTATYDEFTIVIMLQIDGRIAGVVVDEVCDVIKVNAADIEPTPDMNNLVDGKFLSGLVTIEEEMIVLINIFDLIGSDEMALTA
jgi:purine-binding chemotaxis protein CheW